MEIISDFHSHFKEIILLFIFLVYLCVFLSRIASKHLRYVDTGSPFQLSQAPLVPTTKGIIGEVFHNETMVYHQHFPD